MMLWKVGNFSHWRCITSLSAMFSNLMIFMSRPTKQQAIKMPHLPVWVMHQGFDLSSHEKWLLKWKLFWKFMNEIGSLVRLMSWDPLAWFGNYSVHTLKITKETPKVCSCAPLIKVGLTNIILLAHDIYSRKFKIKGLPASTFRYHC